MSLGHADGVGSAFADGTRIDALVVFTGLATWAILIGPAALGATYSLTNFSLATIAITPAHLLADAIEAELIRQAVGIGQTDRSAKVISTIVTVRALDVGAAPHGLSDTSHHGCWIGQEPVETRALGSLLNHATLSFWSAACRSI